jgi:dipeptidyl aminopeptidase/acylaminoacyl peptidase
VPSNWQSINLEAQADKFKGHLQIMMGETDENVLPGSPLQFINALMQAGKDFELIYVPNANHSMNFGPRQYVLRREYEYLVRYLRR